MVVSRTYLRFRRAVECTAVVLLLPLIIPLLAVVALAVKCSSPGPALFVQERPGYRGRLFKLVKFRTMAPVAVEKESMADDYRVTSIGRVLRSYRIDELPQVWNILRGEMSLVGPRPQPLFVDAAYREHIEGYVQRYLVPPGITGLAQISYGRFADIEGARATVEYDLQYIANLSVWLDLRILVRTISIVLSGRGIEPHICTLVMLCFSDVL